MAAQSQFPNPIHPDYVQQLDDDFVQYYNEHFAPVPLPTSIDFPDVRANPHKYAAPWERDYSDESFVRDIKVPSNGSHEVPVRCYEPDPQTSVFGAGPYPVHINVHGGGFAMGSLATDAELCLTIRNEVGIKVLDVDYRLLPENTFLRGHDDVWLVIRWVHEHSKELNIRAEAISVGGISAGAHIAAVCQQLARDSSLDLKIAILGVPSIADYLSLEEITDAPYKSLTENEFAPIFGLRTLDTFVNIARPKDEAQQAEIAQRPAFYRSPLNGSLEGLCRTFVGTASCDPLRDEGEEFGLRLVQAGVKVTMRRYVGVGHAFTSMVDTNKGRLFVEDVCAALKEAHGT